MHGNWPGRVGGHGPVGGHYGGDGRGSHEIPCSEVRGLTRVGYMPRIPPSSGRMKKGDPPRNPKGCSAKARALGKLRGITAEQLAEVLSMMLTGNRQAIEDTSSSEDQSFLQVWTAKLMMESYTKGDPAVWRALLDRVVGLPKQTVAVGGDADGTPIRVETMTTEQKLARLEQLRRARESTEL